MWYCGEERNACLKRRDRCGCLDIGARIMLKCLAKNERREGCVGLMWLGMGSGEDIMNTIIYVSTTYLLRHALHVSTQH